MANPEAFAGRVYANVPRAFFLFLPMFALLLELCYRGGPSERHGQSRRHEQEDDQDVQESSLWK